MIKQRLKYLAAVNVIILFIFYPGFFYCLLFAQAAIDPADSGSVVINEIAWMGADGLANDEWIELRNISDSEIDLDGWTLSAVDGTPSINLTGSIFSGGYFLLERTDDASAPGVVADLIYAGVLGNGGEILELRDSVDILIDVVSFAGDWTAGNNDTKQTMERQENGGWQDSENPGGTPKALNSVWQQPEIICGNGIIEDGEACDDGNQLDGDGCSAQCQAETPPSQDDTPTSTPDSEPADETGVPEEDEKQYRLGDVVINEFVSDPADGEVEWIELYNTLSEPVNIKDWVVQEGSGAKTVLFGQISGSGSNKFFIILKPKGNLNNKGDIIELRDSQGALIDQIAYGAWDDGNTNNNAPAAPDPRSVARKIDGLNSFNNVNDFLVTETPTKKTSNIITGAPGEEAELSSQEMANYDYSSDIIISEVFPDPLGKDNDNEFIELFNNGKQAVNLSGWRLGDESKKRYELDITIGSGKYLVIYRTASKLALNNGNDSVKLFQPLKDEPLQTAVYQKAREDWSYNCMVPDLECIWSEIVTPGAANQIKAINHPPVVDFDVLEIVNVATPVLFDSSDTIDEDGDELKFFWDFGDKATNTLASPEHTYFQTGAFTVLLIVSDHANEVSQEKIIIVVDDAGSIDQLDNSYNADINDSVGIIINEIMPNPIGSDTEGEWIEIYNSGEEQINLLNWQLDDMVGGSRPYTFVQDFWLNTGQYIVVDRLESRLALNNTIDTVRLFDQTNILIDDVEYTKTYEGESYARGVNNKWFWSTVPTPGDTNIISVSQSELVNASTKSSSAQAKKAAKEVIETTLAKISELDIGDLVKATGTVAVLPGTLGTQYFYIVGSPGIQVYNYKKDFPDLRLGDQVEITGELSQSNGEWRIKTKIAADMAILGRGDPPVSQNQSCAEVSEEQVGCLLTVSGEVVEKKGASLYLDDGTDEVLVYIKKSTGISTSRLKEGQRLTATGLLARSSRGLRLMPREPADLIRRDIESDTVGQVLGEVAVSDVWELAQRNRRLELFQYLLIIAIALIVVLSVLLFQQKRVK